MMIFSPSLDKALDRRVLMAGDFEGDQVGARLGEVRAEWNATDYEKVVTSWKRWDVAPLIHDLALIVGLLGPLSMIAFLLRPRPEIGLIVGVLICTLYLIVLALYANQRKKMYLGPRIVTLAWHGMGIRPWLADRVCKDGDFDARRYPHLFIRFLDDYLTQVASYPDPDEIRRVLQCVRRIEVARLEAGAKNRIVSFTSELEGLLPDVMN